MSRLTLVASGLSRKDYARLAKLKTPAAIQDFLDTLPMNLEKGGYTHRSPQAALAAKKAQCVEGALLAAAALWIQGEKPLLLDLAVRDDADDRDHVVALYKRNGYWGAISKTNHAVLRFRDPIYRTLRELALSYFHEWFMDKNGEKTLSSFAGPYDLSKKGSTWVSSSEQLFWIDDVLNALPHHELVPKGNQKFIRRADAMERKAGKFTEWQRSNPRT